MSEHTTEVIRLIVEAVIALVLLVAMTWIVVTPTTSDEAAKGALVIVGSAVGFLFGRQTAPR